MSIDRTFNKKIKKHILFCAFNLNSKFNRTYVSFSASQEIQDAVHRLVDNVCFCFLSLNLDLMLL